MGPSLLFYIGTYTTPIIFGTGQKIRAEGKGIYSFSFDLTAKKSGLPKLAAQIENPSFVTCSPSGRYLYAVNELPTWGNRESGGVSAFAIDPATKELTLLNQQPSEGSDPCHVCVNQKERHVFISNFRSGSLSIFPISNNGALEKCSCFIQHRGSSADPIRQKSPHVHSAVFSKEEDFILVSDLGIDQIVAYQPDFVRGTVKTADSLTILTPPGCGPRHCAFSPDGLFCYIICELSSTLLVLKRANGGFVPLQTVSTLPEDFTGHSTCADLCLSPDGGFVYATNRGYDSIAVFKRDSQSGQLVPVSIIPSGGRTPRSFTMDPSGSYLVVAHQESDTVVIFSVDGKSGLLEPIEEVSIPSPSCVCLYGLL